MKDGEDYVYPNYMQQPVIQAIRVHVLVVGDVYYRLQ